MSSNGQRVDVMRRRRWQKRYRYDRARGRSHTPVDAAPVRAHVRGLLDAGFTASSIARAAGVPHDTVLGVAYGFAKNRQPGRDTLQRPTAAKLSRVTVTSIIEASDARQYVPRVGAQRRIRALQAMGWTLPAIADSVDELTLHKVRSCAYQGESDTPRMNISRELHSLIAQAYDKLSTTPGPSKHSRTVAKRGNYAPPLAWDDETIDDPRATPNLGGDPARVGGIPREDLIWLVAEVGIRDWYQLSNRTGNTKNGLRTQLQRAGRHDLVRLLDLNTYGELQGTARKGVA